LGKHAYKFDLCEFDKTKSLVSRTNCSILQISAYRAAVYT